ncbi:hypothetical protein PVL29_022454 [Vitis rotundifolia]|uniref:Transmembrane protein n=1 Tax=Vitis rotundifolia TaxID=103349 RepID=A0AA39DAY9_VITRO|nr:hypothetical protein PVL29_022454 [Vitis rotundifolia]
MAEGDVEDCSIFPPSNHEGLPIQSQNQQDPPSSSTLSSSLPSHLNVRGTTLGFGLTRWFAFGLRHLRSKLLAIASSFRHYANTRPTLWPFGPASGVITALVLAFFFITLRQRRRRRPHSWEGTLDHLMLHIKERDEKIIQLLYQIIQMNEVLLAHHRVGAVETQKRLT